MLLALDVALLLPPDVHARALALSASLPASGSRGLMLDADHLPHVTVTQQFVRTEDRPAALEAAGRVLHGHPPLTLRVTGGGRGSGGTVWMAIDRTPALMALHERLMAALHPWEQAGGDEAAFAEPGARDRDVAWVQGFRAASSFSAFLPHVTLGHAVEPPAVEPFEFVATTVAACHLGRFCTCRRVLARWTLGGA